MPTTVLMSPLMVGGTSSIIMACNPGTVLAAPSHTGLIDDSAVVAASLNGGAAIMPLCQLGQVHAFGTSRQSVLISSAYLNGARPSVLTRSGTLPVRLRVTRNLSGPRL